MLSKVLAPVLKPTIPTRFQLRNRNIGIMTLCPVCHLAAETIMHCLVTCEFFQKCWRAARLPSSSQDASSFGNYILQLKQHLGEEDFSQVILICWIIWFMRNELIWKGKKSTVDQVVVFPVSPLNNGVKLRVKKFIPQ